MKPTSPAGPDQATRSQREQDSQGHRRPEAEFGSDRNGRPLITDAELARSLEHVMRGRTTFIVTRRLSLASKDELLTQGTLYEEIYDIERSSDPLRS